MKLWTGIVLLLAFVPVFVVRAPAQETSNAADTLENLRSQMGELQNQEAALKIRLEQLDFDLKPENIERHFNGFGSTRPEELRESRRRQLQTEKDRVVAQLQQLASSKMRLEAAITSAQSRAYQQSALGSSTLASDRDLTSPWLTMARVLIGIVVLLLVMGSLVMRVVIRERRKF